jgi:hypothetical protein
LVIISSTDFNLLKKAKKDVNFIEASKTKLRGWIEKTNLDMFQ